MSLQILTNYRFSNWTKKGKRGIINKNIYIFQKLKCSQDNKSLLNENHEDEAMIDKRTTLGCITIKEWL